MGWLYDTLYDGVERVQLPKSIIIRNLRLGILLRLLQLAAVGMVAWMVFSSKRYLYKVLPKGYMSFWIDGVGKGTIDEFQTPLCTKSSNYDYLYAADWIFSDYKCIEVESNNAYWKEGPDTMYIPLSYEESTWQTVTALASDRSCASVNKTCASSWTPVQVNGNDMCECRKISHYFVVGQNSWSIGFEHFYERNKMYAEQYYGGGQENKGRQHSRVSCKKKGWNCENPKAENSELMTVVVVETADGPSEPILQVVAPSAISIPLDLILRKAGLSLETTLNTDTQPNLFKCGVEGSDGLQQACRNDVQEYPLARQTGMEIYMDMEYMNPEYSSVAIAGIPGDTSDISSHDGPLCLIKVHAATKWVGRPKTDCEKPPTTATGFEGSCAQRYYYNLEIVFQASGRFGYFDPVQLAITVGAGLVYLSVPLFLISILSMYLLGPLSSVYYEANKQNIRVSDEVVRLVSRMVTASYAFRQVADDEQNITKEKLLLEIQRGFGKQILNEEGQGKHAEQGKHTLSEEEQVRLCELVFERLDADNSGQIGLQEFVEAFTSGDSVGLEECVHFFDQKSKWNPLARMFQPRTMISGKKQLFPRKNGGEELDMEQISNAVGQVRSRNPAKDGAGASESRL